jgi:hypothetical protein
MTTRATSTPVSVKNLAVQSAATSYGPEIGLSKVKTPFLLMFWLPEAFPFPSKNRMPSDANGPVLVVPVL